MSNPDQNRLMTVVVINDKSQKKDSKLGLPEHKWCPRASSSRVDQNQNRWSKITQVKPIRKYFWSKRSDEYLKKKEKARQEQKARVPKPREFISAMVQNWALTDVLSQVSISRWEKKLEKFS